MANDWLFQGDPPIRLTERRAMVFHRRKGKSIENRPGPAGKYLRCRSYRIDPDEC